MITQKEWCARHGLSKNTYRARMDNWVYDNEKEILASPHKPALQMKMSRYEYHYIAESQEIANKYKTPYYKATKPCKNGTMMPLLASNRHCTCVGCKIDNTEERECKIEYIKTPSFMPDYPCRNGNIALRTGNGGLCSCHKCWNERGDVVTKINPKYHYIGQCPLTGMFAPHLKGSKACQCQIHKAKYRARQAKVRSNRKKGLRVRLWPVFTAHVKEYEVFLDGGIANFGNPTKRPSCVSHVSAYRKWLYKEKRRKEEKRPSCIGHVKLWKVNPEPKLKKRKVANPVVVKPVKAKPQINDIMKLAIGIKI